MAVIHGLHGIAAIVLFDGAVAPKTATNPMAEIHALHGIAAIVL